MKLSCRRRRSTWPRSGARITRPRNRRTHAQDAAWLTRQRQRRGRSSAASCQSRRTRPARRPGGLDARRDEQSRGRSATRASRARRSSPSLFPLLFPAARLRDLRLVALPRRRGGLGDPPRTAWCTWRRSQASITWRSPGWSLLTGGCRLVARAFRSASSPTSCRRRCWSAFSPASASRSASRGARRDARPRGAHRTLRAARRRGRPAPAWCTGRRWRCRRRWSRWCSVDAGSRRAMPAPLITGRRHDRREHHARLRRTRHRGPSDRSPAVCRY